MFDRLYNNVWKYKYLFAQSNWLCFHSLITATSLLAISSTALAACPEGNPDRLDYQRNQERTVLKTSDGRHYACWRDMNAQPITFQRTTYSVAIRCSKTLTVYTHLDSIEDVVIESDGSRSIYQADFLGDRYKCDPQGETMIKSWRYRNGAEVVNETSYSYYPYKW